MLAPLICSTLPFTHYPLAEALQRVKNLGFTAVELPVRGDGVWPGHMDPERLSTDGRYAAEVASTIINSGLRLQSVGCEMAAAIPLAEECRRHRALSAWLADLGASIITIFAYNNQTNEARLKALTNIAKDAGLTLAVETHLNTATALPERTIDLAEALDLSITLDASHFVGQGYEPKDWQALEPRVVAVQVRHCRSGQLQQPYEEPTRMTRRLRSLIPEGFQGPLICEQIHNPEDPEWDEQLAITRKLLLDEFGKPANAK